MNTRVMQFLLLAIGAIPQGCSTTRPAVPAGSRVYFEGVSASTTSDAQLAREFAPLLESEIREQVERYGVVELIRADQRSGGAYHTITVHLVQVKQNVTRPKDGLFDFSTIELSGAVVVTPSSGLLDSIVRRIPSSANQISMPVGPATAPNGGGDVTPRANTRSDDSSLRRLNALALALSIAGDLGLITLESTKSAKVPPG